MPTVSVVETSKEKKNSKNMLKGKQKKLSKGLSVDQVDFVKGVDKSSLVTKL